MRQADLDASPVHEQLPQPNDGKQIPRPANHIHVAIVVTDVKFLSRLMLLLYASGCRRFMLFVQLKLDLMPRRLRALWQLCHGIASVGNVLLRMVLYCFGLMMLTALLEPLLALALHCLHPVNGLVTLNLYDLACRVLGRHLRLIMLAVASHVLVEEEHLRLRINLQFMSLYWCFTIGM